MMETKVRVGVRVRPLLPSEKAVGSEMVIKYPGTNNTQIGMGERAFTYDHVFRPEVDQSSLYGMSVKPMLKPFLDGYNVTVIAYGQTGSGKTYTMGSEVAYAGGDRCNHAGKSESSPVGLIPRFVDDLFVHLDEEQRQRSQQQQARNAVVSASFLEIYGEDVYDLLDDSADGRGRPSLPIREDANAGVLVSGLKDMVVHSRDEALQVLRKGTLNRTTAATLMNVVSSRSHAVFTVTMQQILKPDSGSGDREDLGGLKDGAEEGEEEGQVVMSKLTFVDLAGSERLKRTGAEGERRREGIQINAGLLALGSVINALADEERLVKGKKAVHVPYRQSKLTRLLQDALGGNSQTLFLACVSPAAINASETLSTLYYANRARNIRNKPVKNTDSAKEELRCLRQTARFLKAEVVRRVFLANPVDEVPGESGQGGTEKRCTSPVTASKAHTSDVELMERSDVKAFLRALGSRLDAHLRRVGIEGVDGPALLLKPFAPATPGASRHSVEHDTSRALSNFAPSVAAAANRKALPACDSPPRACITRDMGTHLDFDSAGTAAAAAATAAASKDAEKEDDGPLSLPAAASTAGGTSSICAEAIEGDPEKELMILKKLQELQQHEAAMGADEEHGREALATVEGELEQKESLLEQLRQTLQGYHGMRGRYERLMKDVEALELEKEALHFQLEQTLAAEETQQERRERQGQRGGNPEQDHKAGGASAASAATATALREKLKGVEAQLDRLKVQKKQQDNLQRLAERQKQELLTLEDSLSKLKHVRAGLIKKQRESAKQHEVLIQAKRREMEALRKADRTLQKKMGRLQLENRGAKVLLDRKENCIRTLRQKAVTAETHVLRLLQLQNRNRESLQYRRSTVARRGAAFQKKGKIESVCDSRNGKDGTGIAGEKVDAAYFLIEKVVEERLRELEARRMLELKTEDYEKLVHELRSQAQVLESLRAEEDGGASEEKESGKLGETIQEAEARLEGLDMEMELCAAAISDFQARFDAHALKSAGGSGDKMNRGKKASSLPSSLKAGVTEEAALKAVSELGPAETKVLLSGLMEGVVEARAKVWELESDIQKKGCVEEELRIDRDSLKRRLSESARGFEKKVMDLQCQHQQDLMTLVRSGVGVGSLSTSMMPASGLGENVNTCRGDSTTSDDRDNVIVNVEGVRDQNESRGGEAADEQEEGGDCYDKADQVIKRQLEALVNQSDNLEDQCKTVTRAFEEEKANRVVLEREVERARREARELREALEALRRAQDLSKEQKEEGGIMEELLSAWAELGVSAERRRSLLDKVSEAPSTVCHKLLEEARSQRAEVTDRVAQLSTELDIMSRMLGIESPGNEMEVDGSDDVSNEAQTEDALITLREKLEARHSHIKAILQNRLQEVRRLTQEAEHLQRILGGQSGEALKEMMVLGSLLSASANTYERTFSGTGEDQDSFDVSNVLKEATERSRASEYVALSLSESTLHDWEGEIKALRRARSAMVVELQGLLEQGHGASSLMKLSEEGLKEIMRATLEQVQQESSRTTTSDPCTATSGGEERPISRQCSSTITIVPATVSWGNPTLCKMIEIMTSGDGGATVAGLWAAEEQTTPLADAIPLARFLVQMLVKCWSRRRELLVLCWCAADGLNNYLIETSLGPVTTAVIKALPQMQGEQGESQDGGMTAEEAEIFLKGLDVLLADVAKQTCSAAARLQELWQLLRIPTENRRTDLIHSQLNPRDVTDVVIGVTPVPLKIQQDFEAFTVDQERREELAKAFKRLEVDLERISVSADGRPEVEKWIGDAIERMGRQIHSLKAKFATLSIQCQEICLLQKRQRRQEGILRLNDEIINLEGEARRFEAEASDSNRLVDRKSNSARLLKEERFRKDSKARFARLLERLRQELEEWQAKERSPFDPSLLGEDLQRALSHSIELGGRNWVEGRTGLMHLHTSQPKSRNSSPNQLSPPPIVEDEGAAALTDEIPPPSILNNGDPFARVLPPASAESIDSAAIEPNRSITVSLPAALPINTRTATAGGGLLGINRLTGVGASVSDLLVRGKHIQQSIPNPLAERISLKKNGKEGLEISRNRTRSSTTDETTTMGYSTNAACCNRGGAKK